MKSHGEVVGLVQLVATKLAVDIPPGVSWEQVDGLSRRINRELPPELYDWLEHCNGPLIGPGGIYGIRPDNLYLDIEYRLGLHPVWGEMGYIPIAGDGAGSYYLIAASPMNAAHPILYIDEHDYNRVLYAVASNLWTFIWFYLQEEVGNEAWPFDKDFVLANDPDLALYDEHPKPWEVE